MEENKVAQKMEHVIGTVVGKYVTSEIVTRAVAAILQSPDLRVTIREPKYTVTEWPTHSDVKTQVILENGNYYGETNSRKHSQEIADWLNSKEPK